jgi:hypothetical protein
VAEVVDVEQQKTQGTVHALHAVGFAEEHGEDGFAVVDAGQAVELGIEDLGLAQGLQFPLLVPAAQSHLDAQPPVGGRGGAQNQVVDHPFGEAVDPILGDGVGNQDNGQAAACFLGADGGQETVYVHGWVEAGEGGVEQGQSQGTGFVQSCQRGFGRENDLDLSAGGKEHRFERSQQGRIGRGEEKSG